VRYSDGEEEDLNWDELVPLLPAREACDILLNNSSSKKMKVGWICDTDGKLMSWARHPKGGKWDLKCCWPACSEEGGELMQCFYCSNAQHEECVPLTTPGTHPEHDGEWICCECWNDYISYQPISS
jgi:hypothetical protein